MMKKFILCALGLILAMLTMPVFAQNNPEPNSNAKQSKLSDNEKNLRLIFNTERLKKRLELSDDQVAKIEEINKKYYAEHKTVNDKKKPKTAELKKLLKEENIDINKVKEVMTEIATLETESKVLMVKHYVEFESVLTPEQKVKSRKAKDLLIDHGMNNQQPKRK
jgi:Spy/CpxP family protein refolding chaperone